MCVCGWGGGGGGGGGSYTHLSRHFFRSMKHPFACKTCVEVPTLEKKFLVKNKFRHFFMGSKSLYDGTTGKAERGKILHLCVSLIPTSGEFFNNDSWSTLI